MKKRVISLALVLLLCCGVTGNVIAQTNENITLSSDVSTRGVVTFSCGLRNISGTTYRVWAGARVGLPEQLCVGFALYRVVNNTEIYITSGNNSGYGYYVEASDTVSLTAGTYRLYAYFEGETQTGSVVKTYTIS
jgi:hypothetical protein